MAKITFMGAGSTVFVKNVIGDSLLTPCLQDADIALYDIDATRLKESQMMLQTLNKNINQGRAKIKGYLGKANMKAALTGADFVVNAIQVGGYDPATIIDFEIPKKYGLRQTIADTLGIGGIFRALRTVPVVLDFTEVMEDVCPNAWFLNYVNPMCMITAGLLRGSNIRGVGLCHSVQGCAHGLLHNLGLDHDMSRIRWKIAGINHMSWLLEIERDGKDIYPEIKKLAATKLKEWRKKGAPKNHDMVRLQMMLHFGYYITESSEHNAEYSPYWIKKTHPELIEEFNIPLDEYPRRCIGQIAHWKEQAKEIVHNKALIHHKSGEYAARIMEAIVTDVPYKIGGNVMNTGLITNLPKKACVEVSCLVDRNGVQGCYVGDLPEQVAALNMTNINTQILTVDAILSGKKEGVYHAAMLDPHTSSELTLDEIRSMCDELFKAHGSMIPKMK